MTDFSPTAARPSAEDAMEIDRKLSDEMAQNAEMASNYLKALSHPGRLMILCYLLEGEKSVTALERLLDTRQSSVAR